MDIMIDRTDDLCAVRVRFSNGKTAVIHIADEVLHDRACRAPFSIVGPSTYYPPLVTVADLHGAMRESATFA